MEKYGTKASQCNNPNFAKANVIDPTKNNLTTD